MAWYDVFANFYDASLERHYREPREAAADALALSVGDVVLDCPCGTGQSFPALTARGARIVGVDLSEGMAARARARGGAEVIVGDATTVDPGPVDRLHVFLGMSVFPDPAAVFANVWSRLRSGGRCVIVDVYADPVGPMGWFVQAMARADLERRSWEHLEAVCVDFERRDLPYRFTDGGQIWLASGRKP